MQLQILRLRLRMTVPKFRRSGAIFRAGPSAPRSLRSGSLGMTLVGGGLCDAILSQNAGKDGQLL